MTKYNELKKKIFEHNWYINTALKERNKIIFAIAKLENDNRYNDTKVIENRFCNTTINNTWIIGQVVEITDKIDKNKFKSKYIQVSSLTYKYNKLWYEFISLINIDLI